MTEALVETAELEAPAEAAFEHLAKPENFCRFIRSAEESRRVDLSGSRWLLKGPTGRSVEYEPENFRRCLANYRDRFVHGVPAREDEPEPDVVLDRGELEFKALRDGTTLLLLTYLLAEAPIEPGVRRMPEDFNPLPHSGRHQRVHLHLDAIVSRMLHKAWSGAPAERGNEEGPAPEGGNEAAGAPDGLISLLEEWATEDPSYDEETLPALKENLDRSRPEYRKLFGRG